MVIRNIWAVGRNFSNHAKEMEAPIPERPLIFLKAGSSATVGSSEIWLPGWAQDVHFELELALRFDSFLRVKEAALALDLTERTQQIEAKRQGLPWTLAKSFDEACPMSPPFLFSSLEALKKKPYRIWVNDQLRQETSAESMIFSMDFLLEYVQEYFPVCGGDFLLTGTPEGVGPLNPGDKVKVQMEGEITHIWTVFQHPKPQKP
jgi:2-keto-4-pentenoate hydratase/2-oxohepta-3-ene-1,7-dioic acid hydratase in catechol pathway